MWLVEDHRALRGKLDRHQVVTVGNFDGVHVGHQCVLRTSAQLAQERRLGLLACTFAPHPVELFAPHKGPWRIVDFPQKYALLAQMGVQTILAQRFDRAFAARSPEFFATEVLAHSCRAKVVVVGANFQFGKDRAGTVDYLREVGAALGYEVHSAPLCGEGGEPISSSRIRAALRDGDMLLARRLLGRPYSLTGVVVSGKRDGTRLGFPTVNLDIGAVLSPKAGIYAGRATLEAGAVYPAAVYIGDRPTLGHGPTVEAHLLGFSGDLYGATVTMELHRWLRADTRFPSEAALVRQIRSDIATVQTMMEALGD